MVPFGISVPEQPPPLVPSLKGNSSIRKLRLQSVQLSGPTLFNSPPPSLRNLSKLSIVEFKQHMDGYLQKLLDEPNTDGLTPAACDLFSAAPSNSIVGQVRTLRKRNLGA